MVVTAHGPAVQGPELKRALHELAEHFDQIAVPGHSRYVEHPAGIGSSREYTQPVHH